MRIFWLLLATLIWGMGFVGTRWTFVEYSATWSNGLRYLFAGLISFPFLFKKPHLFKDCGVFVCALMLAAGLQFQTMGIELTSLAKSGFLTVFYAIFTPILMLIFYKRKFRKTYWFLVLLSLIGIAMLCELSFEKFNLGDLYILISALFFSLHILAVDRFAQNDNAIMFNFAQCFYMGVISVAFSIGVEGLPDFEPLLAPIEFAANPFWGFVILSIFSSLVAFSLQVYAQQGVAPHVASLIFLMESVFASIFGFVFFGETLSMIAILGCILLIISVALVPRFTNYQQ